jgi:hypothetical protein
VNSDEQAIFRYCPVTGPVEGKLFVTTLGDYVDVLPQELHTSHPHSGLGARCGPHLERS